MIIKISIPNYDPNEGFISEWEEGFEIRVLENKNYVEIKANKEGLISLAKQILLLAQESVPIGYHLHYDSSNSLEEGSKQLILSKSQ